MLKSTVYPVIVFSLFSVWFTQIQECLPRSKSLSADYCVAGLAWARPGAPSLAMLPAQKFEAGIVTVLEISQGIYFVSHSEENNLFFLGKDRKEVCVPGCR